MARKRTFRYLTVRQIADRLGLSAQTVRRIADRRSIRCDETVGGRRVWRSDRIGEFKPGPPGWWRKR
jgi:excisionase family DNA binding protein